MNFFALNLRAFKKIFLLLFVAIFISNQIDLYLSLHIDQSMRGPDGFSKMVYLWGLLSLVLSLIFPLFLTLVCLFGLTKYEKKAWEMLIFLKCFFKQLLIEVLRSWGKITQWSFALLIPGVIKYIQFTLVPYVVTLSRVYDRGEVDALQMSATIVKNNVWKILGIVFLFHLFIPIVMTSLFEDYRRILETPVACLALTLIDTYIYLLATQCFLSVYTGAHEGTYDKSDVQLERN